MRLPRLQKWMLYASSADVARCRRNILLFSPSSKFRPRVRWKAKTCVPLGMEEPSPARNGAAIPVEHHFVCILLFCKNANFVQCLFSCGKYGRSPVNLLDRGGSKPKWLSAAKRGSKSRGIAPRFTKLLSPVWGLTRVWAHLLPTYTCLWHLDLAINALIASMMTLGDAGDVRIW